MLIFAYKYLGRFCIFINFHLHNLSRAQRIADVSVDIFVKRNNVDFFLITNFVHNGIHAGTVATHECTNRINPGYGACNCQFSSAASFAGDTFNLNRTSVHFRYFLAEKILYKRFIATAQNKLRTTIVTLNVFNKYFDAASNAIKLTLNLLTLWQNTVGLAKLHANNPWLNALDYTGNNRTDFVFKLFKHYFALCFTQPLQHDLFCRLRSHTAKAGYFVHFLNDIAQFSIFVLLFCILKAYFNCIATNDFYYFSLNIYFCCTVIDI